MKRLKRSFLVCLGLAAFSLLLTNIYALFGHGVRSRHMDLMFLVPLAAALIFFLLWKCAPKVCENKGYRLFLNVFASGVATLTVGLLLRGILYIAGGDSVYVRFFFIAGSVCTGAGLLILLFVLAAGTGQGQ